MPDTLSRRNYSTLSHTGTPLDGNAWAERQHPTSVACCSLEVTPLAHEEYDKSKKGSRLVRGGVGLVRVNPKKKTGPEKKPGKDQKTKPQKRTRAEYIEQTGIAHKLFIYFARPKTKARRDR